jgi:hypothetical protein
MGSFLVLENSKKITCGHELFYNSPRAESIKLLQTATCYERSEKEAIRTHREREKEGENVARECRLGGGGDEQHLGGRCAADAE